MKVQKKLHIQITDRLTERSVDLVQYDTGIQLVFYFADFQIPDGTTATLYVQKPSGKFVYQETGIVVSGNTVTVDLENQAVAEYGTVGAQLQLVNGEDTVSTAACTLRVAQSLKDAGAEGSKTVIAAFDVKTAEQIALIKESAQQQIALVEAASVAEQEAIANEGLRVLNTIPADYTATAALAEQAVREKAGAIICKATGEFITLTDASDDYVRGLKLFGKTTQRTTTGKNLLQHSSSVGSHDKYGLTFTVREDGSVLCNGTPTQPATLSFEQYQLTEDIIISGCPANGDTATYRITVDEYKDGVYVRSEFDLGSGIAIHKDRVDYVNVNIYFYTGTLANNMVFYPMIRLASVKDATYEPYTGGIPSPSPDYPQELESVGDGGAIKTTVTGSNLAMANLKGYQNENLFAIDGNCESFVFPCIRGRYYVWSCDTQTDRMVKNIYTDFPAQGMKPISGTFTTACNPNVPFRAEADGYCVIYVNSLLNEEINKSFRVNLGRTVQPFEPYKPIQTLTASTSNGLPGIPVSSGGNYTDENGQQWICDEIDFERGVYVQRVGAVVYTGTESGWGYDTSGKNPCFYRTLHALKLMPYAFSSHFAFAMAPYAKPNGTTGLFGWESSYSVLYIASELTTVDAWKAYLAEQNANGTPVTVKYLLREPIETPISEEEMAEYRALHTHYPDTTVYNDGGAGMEIRYNADTKTYIDNKFTELAQALVNNL